ncbi:MAG: tandem-95 repeat protein, partial [Phycisphaerae bacterium]|nr:tandem-95 repeat protein [Phycisphaerae bacterium]
DIYTTEDNAVTTGNVLANDTDLDGDSLVVDDFTQGDNGTVIYNDDGTFTYTPHANFNGTDRFIYSISDGQGGTDIATVVVHVEGINDAPEATDDLYRTTEDHAVKTGNVLANDRDLDGDSMSIERFDQPAHGRVQYHNDGTFTYTPETNFHGTDSFGYTVSDGQGGTDTAEITISVGSVNDSPDGQDDSVSTLEDHNVTTENVLANDHDVDGDRLALESYTQAGNGQIHYNNNGTFTYTPNANFNGTDHFTYTVSDHNGGTCTATVTVNVISVNDAPTVSAGDDITVNEGDEISVHGNAADVDHDGLTYTWVQTSGPKVTIVNGDSPEATMIAPSITCDEEITLELHVSDGQATSVDRVNVEVKADIEAPHVSTETPADDPEEEQEDRTIENKNKVEIDERYPEMAILDPTENAAFIKSDMAGTPDIITQDWIRQNEHFDPDIEKEKLDDLDGIVTEWTPKILAQELDLPAAYFDEKAFDELFEETEVAGQGFEEAVSDKNWDDELNLETETDNHIASEMDEASVDKGGFLAGLWLLVRNTAGILDKSNKS